MKIQAIQHIPKPLKQNIKKQIYDGLSVYKYIGLPVIGFVMTDILKEKIKKKSDFCDKMGL